MDEKYFGENTMALGIGILVLHVLVFLSVGSHPAKLFSSNLDPHRGERDALEKHEFST